MALTSITNIRLGKILVAKRSSLVGRSMLDTHQLEYVEMSKKLKNCSLSYTLPLKEIHTDGWMDRQTDGETNSKLDGSIHRQPD
jgi:hypothetical protein